MKTTAVLVALAALSSATPVKERPTIPRRYSPADDDPYRIKYLLFKDEQGKLYFEDLTKEVPEVKVEPEDVTLRLYTQKNLDIGEIIKVDDINGVIQSDVYNPSKMSYFIIHGWKNDYTSPVNTKLKAAILKTKDSNVFVVDWSSHTNGLYLTARSAVPQVGQLVAGLINEMMDYYKISPAMFFVIGHSLGAHVAGCVGDAVHGLVNTINGLDPAGPLFTVGNRENRLDENDAEHVCVMHTSKNTLGFSPPIGHSDFYPNGGSSQPGCGVDILGTCAHSRAYEYLEESILEGGFNSTLCESFKKFKKGQCKGNPTTNLCSLDNDRGAYGSYYLLTNAKPPFSIH